jgi:hypothetical protein
LVNLPAEVLDGFSTGLGQVLDRLRVLVAGKGAPAWEQRPLLGDLGEQAQRRPPDQKAIRCRPCTQPEGEAQIFPLTDSRYGGMVKGR